MEHTAVYLQGDGGRKELLGADELVPDQQRIKAIDIDKGFNGYYTYHLKEV